MSVSFTPSQVGQHQVSVTHYGRHVQGSPFSLEVIDINLSIVVIMAKSVINLLGGLVPREQTMGNFNKPIQWQAT